MKVKVTDDCIACGLCETMCPQVFKVEEGDRSHVICDDEEYRDLTTEAAAACPVAAIEVE